MPRSLMLAAAILTVLPTLACSFGNSGRGSDETISREAFVDAYVRLRSVALRHPDEEIPLATRDSILQSLDLTPEDLLEFVEVHGADPTLMHEVWGEVNQRFQEVRTMPPPQPGSAPSRPPDGSSGG